MVKIHGICLVKNEADIIAQTLVSAKRWCDFIYVFDNGSTDGTWETVLSLAETYSQIIPYKQDAKPFHNGLRSEVFNHYRTNSRPGDWWCILDGDELYIDHPRLFLAKVPDRYQVVWKASFEYFFTDEDLKRYEQDPSLYADEVPIEQKIRYYLNNWSELRFFRDSERLVWPETLSFPANLGAVSPERIWLKHFQYRSPQQIQKRLDIRFASGKIYIHELQANWQEMVLGSAKVSSNQVSDRLHPPSWKERILPASALNYDALDQRYCLRSDLMPPLPRSLWLESQTIVRGIPQEMLRCGDRLWQKVASVA